MLGIKSKGLHFYHRWEKSVDNIGNTAFDITMDLGLKLKNLLRISATLIKVKWLSF